jgi:hypothetical protein
MCSTVLTKSPEKRCQSILVNKKCYQGNFNEKKRNFLYSTQQLFSRGFDLNKASLAKNRASFSVSEYSIKV